jgi:hypothetical protein
MPKMVYSHACWQMMQKLHVPLLRRRFRETPREKPRLWYKMPTLQHVGLKVDKIIDSG